MALQEADYGLTNTAFQGSQGRYQGDENLLVKFFTHARLSHSKSEEEGRPIYEDVPYIQIMTPGNKDSIVIRPATDLDKNRFAEHYRKYTAREDQDAVEGTLLEEWPMVTRGMVEELRFFHIRTVEQLASLSDANAQNIMGIQMLKQKATQYLETSKDSATAEALASAHARIDELMARLELQDADEEDDEDEEY